MSIRLIRIRMEEALRHYGDFGECLYCQNLRQELSERVRVISENDSFAAFIPYAALSPYHLWIFPKTHSACFSEQPPETLPALAEIVSTVLGKLHGLLGNPASNLVVRSLAPDRTSSRGSVRLSPPRNA